MEIREIPTGEGILFQAKAAASFYHYQEQSEHKENLRLKETAYYLALNSHIKLFLNRRNPRKENKFRIENKDHKENGIEAQISKRYIRKLPTYKEKIRKANGGSDTNIHDEDELGYRYLHDHL